mmetsp:Transcript_4967/g.12802  ORF Transcript_4967/g.12802 Transcript_4967/m.12802 type:complete len:261 (+) Transcript_4967:80-862(+)
MVSRTKLTTRSLRSGCRRPCSDLAMVKAIAMGSLMAVVAMGSAMASLLPPLLAATTFALPMQRPARRPSSVARAASEGAAQACTPQTMRSAQQLSALLDADKVAKRKWDAQCKASGTKVGQPLDLYPVETLQSFLADPESYSQKVLLGFLEHARQPNLNMDSIDEDDPIAKSLIVRERTVALVRGVLGQEDGGGLWVPYLVKVLDEMMDPSGDKQREAMERMSLMCSFGKKKTALEYWHDAQAGRVPGIDLDNGEEDILR